MAVDLPQLKRGFFGYRPKIVRMILTGREIMFARVWQRLTRTEAELAQTRADLEAGRQENERLAERTRVAEEERRRQQDQKEAARAQVAELEAEIGALRSRVQTLEAEAAGDEAGPNRAAEGAAAADLSTILEIAGRAFTGLVEGARRRNEEQLLDVDAARRELQAEMDRLAARRADLETLLSSVQETIAQARAQVQEPPERLPDVLGPTIDATSSGVVVTVRIPEASNGSNGSVAREDLAAIQEMYGSR